MSKQPETSWSKWSDENRTAIEAAQAASAEAMTEPQAQSARSSVASGWAEWKMAHDAMLQKELHASDRFLVEVSARLRISCNNFRSEEVRAQYAELRERILAALPNTQAEARAAHPTNHD